MKEAIVEVLTEKQDLFMELIHEALEDVYMAKAIEEADDELVSEEEINVVLKSQELL
jgi:hypothetical protein